MYRQRGRGAAGIPPGELLSHVRVGAAFGVRAFAFLVDAACLFLLWLAAGSSVVATLGNLLGRIGFMVGVQFVIRRAPPSVCTLPAFVLMALVYFALFEAVASGTPAKWLFGLRVLSLEGAPPTVREAAVRSVFRLVDGFAAFAVMKPPLHQRLGDRFAGTVVTTLDYALAEVPTRWWRLALPALVFFVLTWHVRLAIVVPFLGIR
jgi:uncharacterized RDD family membrane protein YckC